MKDRAVLDVLQVTLDESKKKRADEELSVWKRSQRKEPSSRCASAVLQLLALPMERRTQFCCGGGYRGVARRSGDCTRAAK